MKTFEQSGIKVFAISYDGQDVLRTFAAKHGINYHLLSDEGSRVIRDFGILNTDTAEDHENFGIPRPGSYLVGEDGIVFEKTFFEEHRKRESVNDMLQEGFEVGDVETGEVQTVETEELAARAYFASPTIRQSQFNVLTVEVGMAEGMHVNGRPLPEGYIPVELTVDGGTALIVDEVEYPEAESLEIAALGDTLPVHSGRFKIKANCVGTRDAEEGPIEVVASLRYQACDDMACYLPQTVTIPVSLTWLPHQG